MGGCITLVNRTPFPIVFYEIGGTFHNIDKNSTATPSSPAKVWYSTRIKAHLGEEIMSHQLEEALKTMKEAEKMSEENEKLVAYTNNKQMKRAAKGAVLINKIIVGILEFIAYVRIVHVKWQDPNSGYTFYIVGDKKEGVYFEKSDKLYITIKNWVIHKESKTCCVSLLLSHSDGNEITGITSNAAPIPCDDVVPVTPPSTLTYRFYNMTPFKWKIIFTPNGKGTGNDGDILASPVIIDQLNISHNRYEYAFVDLLKNVGYDVNIELASTYSGFTNPKQSDLETDSTALAYSPSNKDVTFVQRYDNNGYTSWHGKTLNYTYMGTEDDNKRVNKIINYYTNYLANEKNVKVRLMDSSRIYLHGTTLKNINAYDNGNRELILGMRKWTTNYLSTVLECEAIEGNSGKFENIIKCCQMKSVNGYFLPVNGPKYGYSNITGADGWDDSVFAADSANSTFVRSKL